MNILLSLLIYNPIEAYTMILLCGVIRCSDIRLGRYKILKLFLLGSVNLFVQCSSFTLYGKNGFLILNIVISYIITPILIKIFCLIVLNESVKIMHSFICVCIMSIFSIIILAIFGFIFNENILFYNNNVIYEFISNMLIFGVQILLYTIIKIKRGKYEESCKINRERS